MTWRANDLLWPSVPFYAYLTVASCDNSRTGALNEDKRTRALRTAHYDDTILERTQPTPRSSFRQFIHWRFQVEHEFKKTEGKITMIHPDAVVVGHPCISWRRGAVFVIRGCWHGFDLVGERSSQSTWADVRRIRVGFADVDGFETRCVFDLERCQVAARSDHVECLNEASVGRTKCSVTRVPTIGIRCSFEQFIENVTILVGILKPCDLRRRGWRCRVQWWAWHLNSRECQCGSKR